VVNFRFADDSGVGAISEGLTIDRIKC